MHITLEHEQEYVFTASDEDNLSVTLQGSATDGNAKQALSPMQMVLAAVGGCTGMDVVGILRKQKQEYDEFTIDVQGTRSESIPRVFTHIVITFKFSGSIDPAKAMRAAMLSAEKYCSVSHMLQASVDIQHNVVVNGETYEA